MTIAEVAQKYGLTPDTLRYYERVGLVPTVRRSAGGIRNYSEGDCRWVEYIRCMRSAGVSIEALAEYVKLFQQGTATIPARKQLLLEQRKQIAGRIEELNSALVNLDKKLESYEERMAKCEEQLPGFTMTDKSGNKS